MVPVIVAIIVGFVVAFSLSAYHHKKDGDDDGE